MISVDQALQNVLNSVQNFGVEEVPFLKSLGRILKEPVLADRDFPPFNRVAMDGIAIDYTAFKKGQRSFNIEGIQAAGKRSNNTSKYGKLYRSNDGSRLAKECKYGY